LNPYRVGPWPGVTPRGAGVLLGCAAFLWVGQILVGVPKQPLPDVPVVGVTALLPLAIAVRITQIPGAASAVCAAYLVPASVVALFQDSLAQPPLLVVPAMAFDLALWLVPLYIKRLPPKTHPVIAGAVFGAIFALLEPGFRLFLGAQLATWTGPAVWISVVATSAACAVVAPVLSARGTAA
jgi:hypothetical protein